MLQFYYLHIGYTIFTINEYYYASLSKSIELMRVVNALKYFSIKSLLEVGRVPPLIFILRFMTSQASGGGIGSTISHWLYKVNNELGGHSPV
jgi:hypothetical protein